MTSWDELGRAGTDDGLDWMGWDWIGLDWIGFGFEFGFGFGLDWI